MPSTASTRLRLELQALGENTNTWGDTRLNAALQRIEESIADVVTKTITGSVTLTSSNYVADEARAAVLKLTGSPGATYKVTIPSVEKTYWVHNATDASQTIGTSGGVAATVRSGVLAFVYCDGTDTTVADTKLNKIAAPDASVSLNSQKITSLATGTDSTDAANVGQIAAIVTPYSTLAQNYAQKTDGYVESTNNSAKSWAIGGTGDGQPTAGDAKSWATSTSTVSGGLKGARGYAQDAQTSADAAATSASAASTSATNAAASYDSFDDRYLGAKASDPTLDNDGNALLTGALYWNTSANEMRAWSGSAWQVTYNPSTSAVSSVFGRSGAVTAQAGDYAATDITSGTFDIARLPVASSGSSSSTQVVRADDSRLSDARTPTTHTHTVSQLSDATANGRSLISAADYSAMRTLLSLVPGTNVQAYDAELAAIAGLSSAADRLPYFTGTGTASLATFTSFGRDLVDDANASDARTTLGLGTSAIVDTASTAEVRAAAAAKVLTVFEAYVAAERVTLTDAATIAWDMSSGINFIVTLGGNRTLGAPTNTTNNKSGFLWVLQDGTGGRTLAYNSVFKFAGGTSVSIDTVANRLSLFHYVVRDSSNIVLSALTGVR